MGSKGWVPEVAKEFDDMPNDRLCEVLRLLHYWDEEIRLSVSGQGYPFLPALLNADMIYRGTLRLPSREMID